jgi:hypothetical protein
MEHVNRGNGTVTVTSRSNEEGFNETEELVLTNTEFRTVADGTYGLSDNRFSLLPDAHGLTVSRKEGLHGRTVQRNIRQ